MADPTRIEIGDTVSIVAFPAANTVQGVVLSLPDNQLAYWRVRANSTNAIVYVALTVPLITLVLKGP